MSDRVEASITVEDLEGDHGPVEGVVATCNRCDHQTESFGTGDASIRRCLVLLREECPRGERNYYVDEDDT
jgi:hypothetical protein